MPSPKERPHPAYLLQPTCWNGSSCSGSPGLIQPTEVRTRDHNHLSLQKLKKTINKRALWETDLDLRSALPLVGCMSVGKQLTPDVFHQHHDGALLHMEKLRYGQIKHLT